MGFAFGEELGEGSACVDEGGVDDGGDEFRTAMERGEALGVGEGVGEAVGAEGGGQVGEVLEVDDCGGSVVIGFCERSGERKGEVG